MTSLPLGLRLHGDRRSRGLVRPDGLDLRVELGVTRLEEGRQRSVGQLAGDRVDLGEPLGLAEEGDELVRLAGKPAERRMYFAKMMIQETREEEQQDAQDDLRRGAGVPEEDGQRILTSGQVFGRTG